MSTLYISHIQPSTNQILTTPAITLFFIISLLAIAINLLDQSQTPKPKGCRRVGLPPGSSNLHDEYDPKYEHGVPKDHLDGDKPSWRVKALFSYPIKSCAGVELDTADIVPTGLAFDRQFCFAEYVSPANGDAHWDVRTLRNAHFNKLIFIRPEIWVPDPSAPDYSPDLDEVKSDGVMVIYYPRIPRGVFEKLGLIFNLLPKDHSFQVPLSPQSEQSYFTLPVKVWKDTPISYDYGHHIPSSLHEYLSPPSTKLTLFRVNPHHHRQIYRNAPRKEELGFQTVTGFADAYPIHLLNLASVRDVARRCVKDIPFLSIRRFRANIVITGPGAFEEDHWKRILIHTASQSKPIEIHTVCRTVRCKLPNVDPDTGVRHRSEPDRTLKAYRRIDRGDFTNACLGMQLVPGIEEFTMSVGDSVSVRETGEHCYIKMLAPGEKVEGV